MRPVGRSPCARLRSARANLQNQGDSGKPAVKRRRPKKGEGREAKSRRAPGSGQAWRFGITPAIAHQCAPPRSVLGRRIVMQPAVP